MKTKRSLLAACAAAAILLLAAALFPRPSAAETAETAPPSPSAEPSPAPELPALRISELMSKNRATLLDGEGLFSDWIELENAGAEPVDLGGWTLSDREDSPKYALPQGQLDPGDFLLIFCGDRAGELRAPFSLSEGETVYLRAPSGVLASQVLCPAGEADRSLALGEDGEYAECRWPSPGYPNSPQGYDAFCAASPAAGPLVLNEVMVANKRLVLQTNQDPEDWIELKNISDEPVSLKGWHLSDDRNDYSLFPLPDKSLKPGEILLIFCPEDAGSAAPGAYQANFALNAVSEELYLTDPKGELADFAALHDIPVNGSMGRMDGENGFFYFAEPSPRRSNEDGERRISDSPRALAPDGIFEDCSSVTVELEAPGRIYYSLDGSLPTEGSSVYRKPLVLDSTAVVRAVAVEEGALPSPPVTYSYFLNEGHSLPVLSLAVDSPAAFSQMYGSGQKYLDLPANAALYDGEHSFNRRCGVSMKGWTSLSLPRKSLGLSFSGMFGGDLDCDVFGNGITRYGSLSVRGGQDFYSTIFRNELLQTLGLELSDGLLCQESKYCVLYVNGAYRGIYCLKEDYSRQYYASRRGVDKESVTMYRTPVGPDADFWQEVLAFCWTENLDKDENYRYIESLVDLDGLIDWFLLEGYSANTDVEGNARVFRSTETDGKWQFAAYDFDWSLTATSGNFNSLFENTNRTGTQFSALLYKLLNRPDFRDRVLRRYAELSQSTFSNEHVLDLIDQFQAQLAPEIARDRAYWGLSVDKWNREVDALRRFISGNDWARHNVQELKRLTGLSDAEMAAYFPEE